MSIADDIEPDQQAGCLHPREQYDLFGHAEAEQSFASAWESGRLHHAWMLTGPNGVGKASFAWRAARRVLGARSFPEKGPLGAYASDPVCQLLEAQSNPDLLLIRRPWDDKRKRWRGEITVEEVRKIGRFFEKSAGAKGGWRVCIVDSADELNINSSNALLKILEEPPARGIIFLVTHMPGRLPATVRSRCRRLDLRAPDVAETTDWLRSSAPEGEGSELSDAVKLAKGAPGRAMALLASGAVPLVGDVNRIVDAGSKSSEADLRRLAERVSLKGREALLTVFFESLASRFRHHARRRAVEGGNPSAWIHAARDLDSLVRDADHLYLDKRQSALAALDLSRNAARADAR